MKKFEDLTLEQKRVAIAKDTLKWLNKGRIKVKMGKVISSEKLREAVEGDSLQKILQESEVCAVCQRGGLLYSYVIKCNQFNLVEDGSDISGTTDAMTSVFATPKDDNDLAAQAKLEELFERVQLAMMETAFELDFNESLLGPDLHDDCIYFGKQYRGQKNRFRAILKNIIANKGEFKP